MEKPLAILLDTLKKYRPDKVILFGSTARGEADAQSDLDVIVIKDTQESFTERLEAMAKLCPPASTPISLFTHLRKSARWRKRKTLSSSKPSEKASSSMKPSPEAGLRWLRQAEHDVDVAEKHQAGADDSDACFMAEQASQKALKGFLTAQGRRSILIHSVAQLARSAPGSIRISRTISFPLASWINTTFPPVILMLLLLLPFRLSLTLKSKGQRLSRQPGR